MKKNRETKRFLNWCWGTLHLAPCAVLNAAEIMAYDLKTGRPITSLACYVPGERLITVKDMNRLPKRILQSVLAHEVAHYCAEKNGVYPLPDLESEEKLADCVGAYLLASWRSHKTMKQIGRSRA